MSSRSKGLMLSSTTSGLRYSSDVGAGSEGVGSLKGGGIGADGVGGATGAVRCGEVKP